LTALPISFIVFPRSLAAQRTGSFTFPETLVPDDKVAIPFAELRHLGGEFKAAGQQTEQVVSQLRQAVGQVEPLWEGSVKDVFFQRYQEWETSLRQFSQFLETVGDRLENMATGFEETDQQVARRIAERMERPPGL
jgi:WXG100 family type VII secretion target